MTKYLLKRIGLSIISLIIVIFIIMFLLFKVIDRNTIFNNDQNLLKMDSNSIEIYKYNQLEKYDYLTNTAFFSFLNEKYDNDNTNENFVKAKECLTSTRLADYFNKEVDEGRLSNVSSTAGKIIVKLDESSLDIFENEDVKEFYNVYKKKGYYIVYFVPYYSRYKKGVPQSEGLIYALKEYNMFYRLFKYLSKLISFETINDLSSNDCILCTGFLACKILDFDTNKF